MNYPNILPTYEPFTTPITLRDLHHSIRHKQMETDIVAIAGKLGIDGSLDTASLDYKINHLTKASVGLGNVDNTTDVGKPLSTAQQAYVDAQIAALTSTMNAAITAAKVAMRIPIGSLYWNETDSTDPNTLLGYGTWVQKTDVMIMAVGSTYSAGTTGGAATHTHPLSNAGQAKVASTGSGLFTARVGTGFTPSRIATISGDAANTTAQTVSTGLQGATDAGSTLPPYSTAYVWKRTA